ncbi:unnamed protein product [Camellia sinensis]
MGIMTNMKCIMANGRLGQWLQMLVCVLILLKTEGFYVGITYVQNAVAKGAVCLDGSPSAYHLDKGFGAGINNWLVHFEGEGWCNNVTTCLARKNTRLGSSKKMANQLAFSGILSNLQKFNPDFYNWNRIKVMYCDGSSFTGDVEAVNPATNLHFRGARIFAAVIEDLLAKGMKNAANAIILGGSAGGKDVSGTQHIEAFYNDIVTAHGSAKNLPISCTSKMGPGLQIQTPLFLVNAAYDSWQYVTNQWMDCAKAPTSQSSAKNSFVLHKLQKEHRE